jgi:hypothetical protein
MSYLLAAEKQQQLLLKNAESRPNKEVHTAKLAARKPKGPKGKDSRGKSKQPPPKAKDRSSPSRNSHQKKTSKGEPRSCHKCGRKGHIAKDCQAGDYLIQVYKELQQLKSKQPEAHAVDAPSFEDTENYMVQLLDLGESTRLEPTFEKDPKDQTTGPAPRALSLYSGSNHQEVALLDSATTHTILRDPLYFSFSGNQTKAWQSCDLLTVAGRRNFQFREGRASIVLPGGTTLRIKHAMYAPSAHRSLISFKDLRAHGVHTFTTVKGNSEALELRQGPKVIATAYAGSSGLYELSITSTHHSQLKSALASDFSQSQTENQKLPSSGSLPTKVELWHRRMGHPGTTMFRRMVPILSGHEVCLGDTNKVGVCGTCAQGKMIQRPSRWKLPTELPPRLHRLHGDICGPIIPASGPFRSS